MFISTQLPEVSEEIKKMQELKIEPIQWGNTQIVAMYTGADPAWSKGSLEYHIKMALIDEKLIRAILANNREEIYAVLAKGADPCGSIPVITSDLNNKHQSFHPPKEAKKYCDPDIAAHFQKLYDEMIESLKAVGPPRDFVFPKFDWNSKKF